MAKHRASTLENRMVKSLQAVSSAKGQSLLEKQPKWRECGVVKDWIMLLETLLEWEA